MSYGTFQNENGFRSGVRGTHPDQPVSRRPAGTADEELDALLALARQAGMLVTLDGQIGREKYQSVAGSVVALQRFVAALRMQFAAAVSAPAAACANAGPESA